MLKRAIGIVLSVLLLQFTITIDVKASNEKTSPVKDVQTTHWAFKEVSYVISKGYLTHSKGYFRLNANVTKAEAITAIARSLNMNEQCDVKLSFGDIKKGTYYYNSLCQLVKKGVVDDGTHFYPNRNITRAEFIELLVLAYEVEVDDDNDKTFKDLTNHPLKNYVESAAELGITAGVDGENFAPERNLTRAQLAIYLYKTIEFKQKLNNYELIYDFLSKDYKETIQYSDKLVTEVIVLVNKERGRNNLPPLVEDPHLSQIAIIKSQDFIERNYFDHFSPYFGNPWDLAALFDYDFLIFGENIAKHFNSPSDVVSAWMESPTHRENILRPQYSTIGVGINQSSDGTIYWVQMFAGK